MPVLSIESPFSQILDVDGDPLKAGHVYVGQAGLDAETNPIDVYWDEALTVPAVQPIRTINGYFSRSGSPSNLFCNGDDFSVTVKNKNMTLVFSALSQDRIIASYSTATKPFKTLADLKLATWIRKGMFVEWLGYHSEGDGGGSIGEIVAAGTGVDDGGSFIDLAGSGLQVKNLFVDGVVRGAQFGAKADGVTDDAPALNSAGAFNSEVYLSGGTYLLNSNVSGSFYSLESVITTGTGTVAVRQPKTETVNPASPRSIIQYGSATSIKIREKFFPMAGFRFNGHYKKNNCRVFEAVSNELSIDIDSNLAFGMSSVVLENWYAIFACGNQDQTQPTFKAVPFLRVESVAGSVVTLRKAGEGIHGSAPQTYTWPADALNGVDCLVISETVDGRTNAFSGRETTITDSTSTTVTLESIGSVAVGDFLLPAPDGFDFYRYCGSVYYDTAEVRNIADSGSIVRSRGIYDLSGTAAGAITKELRTPAGYISPLATSVIIQGAGTLGTASEGQYVEIYDIDSGSHTVSNFDFYKAGATSQSFATHDVILPFSFGQQWYYSNAGTLAASVTNLQSNYWGWIEP